MKLGLRFISGKYQGGQFPLEEGKLVRVGRSSGLEMVLVEEMVSRHHASLILTDGKLHIHDLGSTNGTFVNGERVTKAVVAQNDRILIGSNILKVVALTNAQAGPSMPTQATETNTQTAVYHSPVETGERRMSGHLEEIPLPDLLQLFGISRKSGVLLLQRHGALGRLVLKEGRIQHAELLTDGSVLSMAPLKVAYRLLTWEKGYFELGPEARGVTATLDLSAQELLMEGFRQKDELDRLAHNLPPFDALLEVDVVGKLSELEDVQLDVWQVASRARTVEGTMNGSPHPDVETAEAIVKLLDSGFLRVQGHSANAQAS